MIEQFHFIRPAWLLSLLPLLLVSWLLFKHGLSSRSWQSVIDPALLPHLLNRQTGQTRSHLNILLFFIAALASILSLAGPTWEKLPQPVFKQQSALVIALDLSRSMDAGDIKPSRLTRARHKISDLLKLRREGQTALIAYAAEAFTVTPLTDDTDTIAALLPSLSTDIMPAQGSRLDLAIQRAMTLLSNAGIAHGDILLVTDGAGDEAETAVRTAVKKGHRVSILAVGTAAGAPIPRNQGGFLKDASGSIVIPRLDIQHLRQLALQGQGRLSLMTADDRDIQSLQNLMKIDRFQGQSRASELHTDQWQEQGHWLLLIVIPLALLIFRKGYLALLIALILPVPQPAQALSWDELWLNSNQRAAQALQQNQADAAAKLFTDPAWKASAEYRAGQFDQAAQDFAKLDTAEGFYNQANALARAGKIAEAIQAYQQALQLDPAHEDARYNKELLEKQQQQQEQKNKSDNDSSKDAEQQNSSSQDGQSNQADKNARPQDADGKSSDDAQSSEDSQSQQQEQSSADKSSAEKADQQQAAKEQQAARQQEQQQSSAARQKQQPTDQGQDTDEQTSLSQQAAEQWLRRIPDDPGGLLRNKFKYQYKQQKQHQDELQNW